MFTIYSDLYNIPNGNSENWQKAIGGHSVWVRCLVVKKRKHYTMYVHISFRDVYNFNEGANDIGSGAPDDENGRFEELGWARSFETYGYINREVKWWEQSKKKAIVKKINQGTKKNR